jgi:hypothetical protein
MFVMNNFFKVHYVTKVSLYFRNLRLLIPVLSRLLKKFTPFYSVLYSMT